MIINPVEIMDEQERRYQEKNPEMARRPENQDRFPNAYIKPEVYERELERRRDVK